MLSSESRVPGGKNPSAMRLLRMSATRSAVLVLPSRARSPASPLICSAMPEFKRTRKNDTTWVLKDRSTIPYLAEALDTAHSFPAPRPLCEVPMSTTPPPPSALTGSPRPVTPESPSDDGAFGWLRALGPSGRRAFGGAFGGYALDSYDYFTLPLTMVALSAYFGLNSGQTGLLTTVTLIVSAVGGALAGVLADRVGRVKALLLTVITYAVFTVACGFAPDYETLLVFRALQGLGFGGEWAVGAILVAEYAGAKHRGRTLGAVQSAWAVGWALAVIVYTAVFSLVDGDLAWRVMFWTGALPALLVVWVRRSVQDAPEAAAAREKNASKGSFAAIFRPSHEGSPDCCAPLCSRCCSPRACRAATTPSPPGCRPTSRASATCRSWAPAAISRSSSRARSSAI